MSRRLTPTMQQALASLASARLVHRPHELPGGQSTARALITRGLAERDGQWVRLTPAGRQEAHR
jgi:hypothetical protein